MNYFSHGRRFVDRPYFLAGTAIPDWLGAVDRRVRVRSKNAEKFIASDDELVAKVAAGVLQHHHDDRWFHQNTAFNELCLSFAKSVREFLPEDDGFRPSFLGHIMVELLLDAHLIKQQPETLDRYYEVIANLDAAEIQRAVNVMATKNTKELAPAIQLFCERQFLYDYADDATLLKRLNNVMQRVKLPELPMELLDFIPRARQLVGQRQEELLNENDTVA